MRVPGRGLAAAAVAAAMAGCEPAEKLGDRFREMTPWEAYQASLAEAGLAETALAKEWTRAGQRALESSTPVTLPFQEEGFVTPESPAAAAYRLVLPRGRKLVAEVSLDSPDGTRLFVDVFRAPADDRDPFRPVFSSDSTSLTFVYEPWRGGDFVLRVQPELLRGGSYRVALRQDAQLEFPVQGRSMRDIGSRFGAARDGGRRRHAGVDVFAPRGTPVVAASGGRVGRVSTTPRGGKVVWVRDSARNASLYYAHLDSQHVRGGEEVQPGDTLGFVGNTGNARTTPPHLHFGLYRRGEGAIDPYPFLDPPRGTLPAQDADLALLGGRARPRSSGVRLRAGPSLRADVLAELDGGAAVRVVGAAGSWYRVRLAGGREGYMATRLAVDAGDDQLADRSGTGAHSPPLRTTATEAGASVHQPAPMGITGVHQPPATRATGVRRSPSMRPAATKAGTGNDSSS